MKLKATTKHFLRDAKTVVLGYYGVILAMYLVNLVIYRFVLKGQGNLSMSADGASVIFLFIIGLCSFKDNFLLLTQCGVSRKTIFLGRILSAAVIAPAMVLIDQLLLWLAELLAGGVPGLIFMSSFEQVGWLADGSGSGIVYNILLSVLFYYAVFLGGYFVTLLYYRLNTLGKILVSVGVPALFTLGPIGLAYLIYTGNTGWIDWLANLFSGASQLGVRMLVTVVGIALIGLFSWLLSRRAVVKR